MNPSYMLPAIVHTTAVKQRIAERIDGRFNANHIFERNGKCNLIDCISCIFGDPDIGSHFCFDAEMDRTGPAYRMRILTILKDML